MKIKKSDNVIVVAGKDKGKTGSVLQLFIERGRASVEGINLAIKHLRSQKRGEKGQRVEFPAPIDLSNLMIFCKKCKKGVRVGFNITKNKEGVDVKSRVCKKCGGAV